MIAHLCKLIWNRRRANALILTELLAAFLVLAGLGTAGAYYLTNLRRPLGFTIDDVWVAQIGHGISGQETVRPESQPEVLAVTRQMLETVKALPEVEAVTGVMSGPYVGGITSTDSDTGDEVPPRGQGLEYNVDVVTDDFPRVFGLTIVAGRWFGREDDGGRYTPVVINETMARDFFGGEDPVGRQVTVRNGLPLRVVGVIAGYRVRGELAPPQRYLFSRYRIDAPDQLPYQKLFVKTRPGTPAAFEGALETRLGATARRPWNIGVRRLGLVRDTKQSIELMPLKVAAVVAAFLMAMVVLGLTGVLWQNVTRRTKEIGLRRAKGATRPAIHVQILGELMVMTSFAVGLGALLLAHVPVLGLIDGVAPAVYLQGALAAALAVGALTLVCGFYPARLAARVEPALALRDD